MGINNNKIKTREETPRKKKEKKLKEIKVSCKNVLNVLSGF